MAPSPRRGPRASLHPSSDPATPSGWRSSRRELFERVVQALPSLTGNGRDRSTAPCRRMGSFCGPGHATTFPFVSPSRLSSASKPCRQLARRKTPIQAAALGPSRHRTDGQRRLCLPSILPGPTPGPGPSQPHLAPQQCSFGQTSLSRSSFNLPCIGRPCRA